MLPDTTSPTIRFLSGSIAFYAIALSSQFLQYKLLKISTGTKPAVVPLLMGGITVAVGSGMAHLAGVAIVAASNEHQTNHQRTIKRFQWDSSNSVRAAVSSIREMVRPMTVRSANHMSQVETYPRREAWMHAMRICILGLVTYKAIFRSHFYSLSPSSYTAIGSFARRGIPAPSNYNYATPSQRIQLEQMGRMWGCHTCGTRMLHCRPSLPKFHGDHIPPVSVAKQMNNRWFRRMLGWKVAQTLYPQCRECSNKQGGLLSQAIQAGHKNLHAVGGGTESCFHGWRWRMSHLTGGVVALVSVGNEAEKGVVESSRRRVLLFQNWLENSGKQTIIQVRKFWKEST